MKYAQAQIDEAKDYLLSILPPGSTVYTKLNHVARSGMSRSISCYVIRDNVPQCIDWYVCRLEGCKLDAYDGIRMGGCGMDMGFALVYSLSHKLYPDGFGIEGQKLHRCKRRPATKEEAEHMLKLGYDFRGRNGDTSGWDNDGGYALKQAWL